MDFENIYNELNSDNVEEISETKKITYNKPKTAKKSKAVCPVLDVISNSKVIIEFNNFGLIINTDNAANMKGKSVEIEYSGTGEYIVSQSPEAKTKLEDKSKVRLMLGTKQVKK